MALRHCLAVYHSDHQSAGELSHHDRLLLKVPATSYGQYNHLSKCNIANLYDVALFELNARAKQYW